MGFFKNKKNKKEEKKVVKNANDFIQKMILEKALKENKEKELKIEVLENNMEVLQKTIENIRIICNESKTSKVSKAIFKEIGE